jgi:hypothetical protein
MCANKRCGVEFFGLDGLENLIFSVQGFDF